MGDTGSLFLGGAVAGLAFACDQPLVLVLVGLIYVIETLSDIAQVAYYKATKNLCWTKTEIRFAMQRGILRWKASEFLKKRRFIIISSCAAGVKKRLCLFLQALQ